MNFIEIENKYYILASSALADQEAVVLKQGDTFAVFNKHGDLHQIGSGSHGVYHNGTRFLSETELTVNDHKPLMLSANPREDNQMIIVDLTNPDLSQKDDVVVQRGTVHISRVKFLWKGCYHEKITLLNFGLDPVEFNLKITFDADYADIFEARGTTRKMKGKKNPPQQDGNNIVLSYTGLDDILRKTIVNCPVSPDELYIDAAVYKISLAPKDEKVLEFNFVFVEDQQPVGQLSFEAAQTEMNGQIKAIEEYCAVIHSSNEQFNEWVNRSKSDLITMSTKTNFGLYPYAGIPWYSTALAGME
jgi:glycogen debranching enzyme